MSHALPREWFGSSIRNDGVKREKERFRLGSIAVYLAAAAVPVAALLFYNLQGVQVIRTGYEIDRLRQQHHVLQAERDRLAVELASLQSLDVVARLAARDLGMVPLAPDRVITVRIETSAAEGTVPRLEEEEGIRPARKSLTAWLRRVRGAL
jgi:cell division protein FtsL